MTGRPYSSRWKDRSEEARLRCQVTELRGRTRVQCTEDRRYQHEHQWRGKPFQNQDQETAR